MENSGLTLLASSAVLMVDSLTAPGAVRRGVCEGNRRAFMHIDFMSIEF